jgi:hypothetical protein
MTSKGFGKKVSIPADRIQHPKNTDEMLHLKREVEGYVRPEYASCKYLYTTIVNTKDIKIRKNVGRKRGNDSKVYDRVARSLEKGYKIGKLPPVILYDNDNNQLYDWLVNGNHRWLWYIANDYEWMLVDVYDVNEGYDNGDVIDEVGLLHQPQPDGTESNYEDYKTRGLDWVRRQQEKGITVTQEMVDEWVEKFAANEIAIQRTNLKKQIFKQEVKNSFLTNYTARAGRGGIVEVFKEHGIVILDSGAIVTTKVVNRLYEASQKVWLRDFLPVFLDNAANGIKTVVNFYVNTTNVSDGDELLSVIKVRVKEVFGIIDSLDVIYSDSDVNLRDFLIIGKRPPQIVDVDKYDRLQDIEDESETSQTITKMWQMTFSILQAQFGPNIFTADEAYNAIRPIRTTVSKFKSEESFRGTILRELQVLEKKGMLNFSASGTSGTYRIR